MSISLCMIVGNEEPRIRRCLRSFAPLADEICVVRAIGSRTPDATLDIARDEFGARVAEYHNAPEHADWPHVDDFAAARNASFAMARCEYIFWADADDILIDGAERARHLAEIGGYACYLLPYEIHGQGMALHRERLILRGSGQWQWPVHECFQFAIPYAAGCGDDHVIVRHLGGHEPHGSHERNLRILRSLDPESMPTGLLYHYVLELLRAADIEAATRLAHALLEREDLAAPERMETFINLAISATDPKLRLSLLHQAHAADPTRREPLALLVNEAMNMADGGRAVAYALQMRALPEPETPAWNHRRPLYTWLGEDLYAQALRVAGRPVEADAVRRRAVARFGRPRIALLHATRGRALQAAAARKRWFDLAEQPELIEHIFGIDEDDADAPKLGRFRAVPCPPGRGSVWAWNMAALASEADIMVQVSDDMQPFYGWDTAIVQRLGDLSRPAVLAVSDGLRPDKLLTLAICTRAYFNQDYFLLHPEFESVFSDNWFTELAYRRGQVIEARDLIFKHEHPLAGKTGWDATYAAQNAPERYQRGSKLLERLRAGRDWSFIPGWFNYWWLYEEFARALKRGDRFAEIGTWLGRSLCYLGQRLQALGRTDVRLLAVDHFRGEAGVQEHETVVRAHGGSIRAAFEANLERCGLTGRVDILEGDSAGAATAVPDHSLAICYIDAAHDYESVRRDIAAWRPKVRPGGILAGHDAQHEPVMRAVRELLPAARVIGPVWVMNIL